MKVLWVDTISHPQAQSEMGGVRKAYQRVAEVCQFDYRKQVKKHGEAEMNSRLGVTAIQFQPDLVHLGKCESVTGETVRRIKAETKATVVHCYGDLRWETQEFVVNIGREADWTLFLHNWQKQFDDYLALGVNRCGFWMYGVDEEVFYPRDVKRDWSVVFAANLTAKQLGLDHDERLALPGLCADKGLDVHLFASGWDSYRGRKGISIEPFIDMDELAVALSRSKVALSHSHPLPMYTSWRRPFYAMACGAMVVTNYFPGLETVFENGVHLCWADSPRQMAALAKTAVQDEAKRRRIAEAGRQEVLAKHTWDHCIAEIVRLM